MSEVLTLNVGDSVVYPNHGAGVIQGISNREVMGKEQTYFEIELLKGGMQVSVPVAHAATLGLRHVTLASQIPALLEAFNPPDLDLPSAWTPRHRKEQQILQEGDIERIARLVGTLHRRAYERTLAVTERAIFDEAKRIIVTEVAVALGVIQEAAVEYVDQALDSVVA